jgi:hypothetical protein
VRVFDRALQFETHLRGPSPLGGGFKAMATAQPNEFELHDHEIKITYFTTGITGQPSFTYHDQNQTLNFTGQEITVEETAIGKLVSVTIQKTVDFGSTSFSVLIPVVFLASSTATAHFTTDGIRTVHEPQLLLPVVGVREVYQFSKLNGTARVVIT